MGSPIARRFRADGKYKPVVGKKCLIPDGFVVLYGKVAMESDQELLRRFSAGRDEKAFNLLVDRYLGLIFHTALRRTGSRELAEEVSQNVLCVLARKSAELVGKSGLLPAWLHKAAVYESSKAMRTERSYLKKKRALAGPEDGAAAPPGEWNEVVPRLDAALERLGATEKRILLLHYFENRTFGEIAGLVGKTPAAVQRQAHRAVEKLASLMRNRSAVLPAAVIAAGLTAEFSKAAPVGLGGRLAVHALAQAPVVSSSNLLAVIMSSKAKSWLPLSLLAIICPVAVVGAVVRHEDNRRLEVRIAGLEAGMAADQGDVAHRRRTPGGGPQVASAGGTIDWQALAEEAKRADKETPTSRTELTMARAMRLIGELDSQGVSAGIREIDLLDESDEIKGKLKLLLLMGTKIRSDDPAKAVELFFPLADERNRLDIELSKSWTAWLEKDFASAAAWFDARVEEGAFASKRLDGKSRRRSLFEGALVGALMKQSPSVARGWLEKLPVQRRTEVFLDPMLPLNETVLAALPGMLREVLPASEQSTVISDIGSRIATAPRMVDEFLGKVNATPAERQGVVLEGVRFKVLVLTEKRKIQREDLAEVRSWAERIAPGTSDRVVGRTLISGTDFVNHKVSFDEAVALLREYGTSDDALLGFTELPVSRNYGRASMKLAEEIQDAAKRGQALRNFR
jgi:RNA polymerase sigma factor (sigma-70 family)